MAASAPAMAPARCIGFEVTAHAVTNRNTIYKLLMRTEIMSLTCEASDARCKLILYRVGHAELSTRLSWWKWCRKPQSWSARTRQPHVQEMSGRLTESRVHLLGGNHLNCRPSPSVTIGGWLGSLNQVWHTNHYVHTHKNTCIHTSLRKCIQEGQPHLPQETWWRQYTTVTHPCKSTQAWISSRVNPLYGALYRMLGRTRRAYKE